MLDSVKATARSPIAIRKRNETMKRNGTYRSSSPEETMYACLLNIFRHINRQHEFSFGDHSDFFVPSVDMYVQVDGVYWHGLKGCNDTTARAKFIHITMKNDQAQNEFFQNRSSNCSLLRISDEFIRLNESDLEQLVHDGSLIASRKGLHKLYV